MIGRLSQCTKKLFTLFDRTIDEEWLWFDDKVSYANSRIPHAMILAGMLLKEEPLIQRGLKVLDWLIEKQFINGIFSPIGNNGWLNPPGKGSLRSAATRSQWHD